MMSKTVNFFITLFQNFKKKITNFKIFFFKNFFFQKIFFFSKFSNFGKFRKFFQKFFCSEYIFEIISLEAAWHNWLSNSNESKIVSFECDFIELNLITDQGFTDRSDVGLPTLDPEDGPLIPVPGLNGFSK